MVYKTKKQKFAILVDEFGRKKESISDLLDLLKEEYPFLKQANRIVTKKRVNNAKKTDVIMFGFSKKYDFRVVTEEEWEEYSVHRRTPLVELSNDWEEVEELLEQYSAANYPDEFDVDYEDDYDYCCKKKRRCYEVDLLDVDVDNIYVLQQPKKKSPKKTRKVSYKKKSSKLGLEKASVHEYFVKVGWDVFDIFMNNQGEEYTVIDGNTYWIDRDWNGNGKLSVQ